ncbi:MAG: amidase family protein, partial [Thermoanaerobaculia bacterium]|nr:amidase family protein [Thermoanaerobaculia bacterium]
MLESLEAEELSSREIVAALLARADEIDPTVNSLIHRFDDRARRRAGEADQARSRGERWGPLHGLPLTVKESIDTRGVASTLGLASRRDRAAEKHAVVVRAALDAGAILLGKTNVPQTLASPIHTVNPLWGRTNNPWKITHSSGGSSGGEAAALASGISVLGIGTDIGGSIRVPAAFCGICGLKPTDDRWSNLGANSFLEGVGVASSQTGPMARTSGDLQLLFDTLAGPAQTGLDPLVPPLPKTVNEPDVSDLRVGCYEHDGFFTPAPAVARAVREAAALLAQRGIEVVSYRPPGPREVPYLMFQAAMADGGRFFRDQLTDEEEVIEPVRNVL